MKTTPHPETALGPVLTLSQLAAQLGVTVKTLYDLRSQGRGPRGFCVGRELRFRVTEVGDLEASSMSSTDNATRCIPIS
jgi:hypothetical protein